jgi:enamine deaminase RidA (YjgF/YER057c/UK114 family)
MDNFKRTGYQDMEMDIANTLTVGNIVFLSGTEAMTMVDGQSVVPEDVFEQTEVVVRKMNASLVEIGLTIENMVKHTIYLKKDSANPVDIIRKFHDECYKYGPGLREKPSTGTLVVVEGLAVPTFKIEVDSIAAIPN